MRFRSRDHLYRTASYLLEPSHVPTPNAVAAFLRLRRDDHHA